MSSNEDQTPRVYLTDGVTNSDPAGCTIQSHYELTPGLIPIHETHDLDHLVHWALSHGYGGGASISLTITWDRDEIEESLGCKVTDDFLRAAQEWLEFLDFGRLRRVTGVSPKGRGPDRDGERVR